MPNDNNYLAAQRAYDRQEPPDNNTNDEGECEHEWKVTRAVETDGETLREYKCKHCGKVDHD